MPTNLFFNIPNYYIIIGINILCFIIETILLIILSAHQHAIEKEYKSVTQKNIEIINNSILLIESLSALLQSNTENTEKNINMLREIIHSLEKRG